MDNGPAHLHATQLKPEYFPNIREQTRLAVRMLIPVKFLPEAGLPKAPCNGGRMAISAWSLLALDSISDLLLH